jgi:hypothetical protein
VGLPVAGHVGHRPQHELAVALCAPDGDRGPVGATNDDLRCGCGWRRSALRAGLLRCPDCAGAVPVWSPARTRRVRTLDGAEVELTPTMPARSSIPASDTMSSTP